ncbi:sirohydrochlorin ferrochelatase, chloroplastic-like isoform X1 [Cryptomeria japonica]|uniref:sirohydrochlorin ferrochelatase, chloroplastic-like isoform X1 n=1 Tax=Cryptomeria japonica TaxID=3369 RepID=UPI0025AC31A0|nr:sirohydrochlorin ferrochelatase, chloroplastic-like isoform X1 [Cryptomeria japonica]
MIVENVYILKPTFQGTKWQTKRYNSLRHRIMSANIVRAPTRGLPLVGQTFSPSTHFRSGHVHIVISSIYSNRMESKNLSAIATEQSDFRKQDAVIIVDHGSRRQESNSMLLAFVDMYKEKTGHPIVEPAHMEIAKPTIKEAFDSCVNQGAARVIISPYFLSPGRHWKQDIPALAAEAAKEHPGIPYIVTAPLGLHELMVNVVED